jgi:hypothetical protein
MPFQYSEKLRTIRCLTRRAKPPTTLTIPSDLVLSAMSALGQKQTSDCRPLMPALPPKADIRREAPLLAIAVTS